MNKAKKIIIWSFLIIITIFTVISFIWTNYAPINRIPIKEKISFYLDNTSYIKVKRNTSLNICDEDFEVIIKDDKVDSFKLYIKNIIDILEKNFVYPSVMVDYNYIFYFYDSNDKLLFKIDNDIIEVGFEEYITNDSNNTYKPLVENIIKDMDKCYPAYEEHIESLKRK